MSIPIWVVDPAGNNNPYLKIVKGKAMIGGFDLTTNLTIQTSVDGVTWTNSRVGLPGFDIIAGLAFGSGTWIAVGYHASSTNIVLTSGDAVSWMAQTPPSTLGRGLQNICFGAGAFFMGDTNGKIWRSSDMGVTWSNPIQFPSSVDGRGNTKFPTVTLLNFVNNKFYAGVYVFTSNQSLNEIVTWTGRLYSSSDGLSWSGQDAFGSLAGAVPRVNSSGDNIANTITVTGMAFRASSPLYVMAGTVTSDFYNRTNICVATSTDGISFTGGTQIPANAGSPSTTDVGASSLPNTIAYGNGVFVLAGTFWTGPNPPPQSDLGANPDLGRNEAALFTSSDGVVWTKTFDSSGFPNRETVHSNNEAFVSVIFKEDIGMFIAVGSYQSTSTGSFVGVVATSSDGLSWSTQTNGFVGPAESCINVIAIVPT